MSDLDVLLDAAVAEKDRADWLSARDAGFGCSDLGALWLILGWAGEDVFDWHEVDVRPATCGDCPHHSKSQLGDECAFHRVEENAPKLAPRDKKPPGWCPLPEPKWRSNLYRSHPQTGEKDYVTPRYLMESWQTMKRCGLPRLIAEKAGYAKPRASSDAQEEGKHKERLLFQQSRLGQFDTQAFYAVDDATMLLPTWREQVVSEKPLVLRDLAEPRLLCTIEAWELTPKGVVAWELKTDRLGIRTKPPWAQRLQAIGQAVVLGAQAWGIQYGPEWAKTDEPAFPNLRDPMQWGPFAVRDEDREMVRRSVRLGWELVEAARAR